jgi:hypothetical protein
MKRRRLDASLAALLIFMAALMVISVVLGFTQRQPPHWQVPRCDSRALACECTRDGHCRPIP